MIVDVHRHVAQPVSPRSLGFGHGAARLPFDSRVLRFDIEIMDADRIMLGSDVPFPIGDQEPRQIVAAAIPKSDQVASIEGVLAAKLFRI